jgi:hypothetical protein
MPEPGKEIHNVSFNFYQSDIDTLSDLAYYTTSGNMNQALREAVAAWAWLHSHVLGGAKILIELPNGEIRILKFKPSQAHENTEELTRP